MMRGRPASRHIRGTTTRMNWRSGGVGGRWDILSRIWRALYRGFDLDDMSIVDTAGRPVRESLFDIWESTKDELLIPSSTSKEGKIYVSFRKAYFFIVLFFSFFGRSSSRQRYKTAWGISKVTFRGWNAFSSSSGFDESLASIWVLSFYVTNRLI